MNKINFLLIVIASMWLISCGGKSTDSGSEEAASEETATESGATEKLGADAEIKEGQRVFFVNLSDGDQVTSPFKVEMGLEGMEVEAAGELSLDKGHHHILINEKFNPKGAVVPADSTHIHFGQGQTEAELSLPPGNYVISLQFADGWHRSYGEQMSSSINIEVIEER